MKAWFRAGARGNEKWTAQAASQIKLKMHLSPLYDTSHQESWVCEVFSMKLAAYNPAVWIQVAVRSLTCKCVIDFQLHVLKGIMGQAMSLETLTTGKWIKAASQRNWSGVSFCLMTTEWCCFQRQVPQTPKGQGLVRGSVGKSPWNKGEEKTKMFPNLENLSFEQQGSKPSFCEGHYAV